ncbi:MAG TPA: NAD(P)/FAD-dependent oxidoreductase [Blastocatellia bacterium]|jgi:flavin-dependent dehydrogenase|nr:NAD(P)/FAD-dependent oxidoreductase [Blastocatellia bacterium]
MKYDVIVVGGGPAGSSAAIELAQAGCRVLVLESKRMPREKLCGEFITPECQPALARLGILDELPALGARTITGLTLTAATGRQISTSFRAVSSQADFGIGLSRALLDQALFERARRAGAHCLEGFRVKRCLFESGLPSGVRATSLSNAHTYTFNAPLIIDASGRNSRLTVARGERTGGRRGSRLYAFKAHLRGVEGVNDAVELYFFRRGYGGLSRVENGLVNLCFIVSESTLKATAGDPTKILRETIISNSVARDRLASARVEGKWHSCGPLRFGRKPLARDGIIAVGDASGMIDPFTGTGIQMALRTGEMVAQSVVYALGKEAAAYRSATPFENGCDERLAPADENQSSVLGNTLASYGRLYEREFGSRMAAASLLRRIVFSTSITNTLGFALSYVPQLTRCLLRTTRHGSEVSSAGTLVSGARGD